jgi:hypothetical protein
VHRDALQFQQRTIKMESPERTCASIEWSRMEKTVQRRSSTMNSQRHASEFSKLRISQQALASLLALVLLCAAYPQCLVAQDQQGPPQVPSRPPYTQQTPEDSQQLVAPIALYPDSLVAQILAASTFPEQVVEADRWVQSHPELRGDALAQTVDQQPWDPSVKALTAFPSVLGNMDKNLSWTSSLGDAYYNQEQDVMDAVQAMRRRAQEAGNLLTTEQQTVTSQDSTRGSNRGMAGVESVSGNMVWRPAPFLRSRLRDWLLRRLWLGLASLGVRLASPGRNS